MDKQLDNALRLGVRLVVASALEAGREPATIPDDVAAAFRSAIAGDYAEAAEAEDLDESGPETYRPAMTAKILHVTLHQAGRDLEDLMAQETLWEAVRAIAAEEVRNPENRPR